MNAYCVQRNKYYSNTKSHVIFSPPPVCDWLRKILEPEMGEIETVFDPSVGSGNLLAPFKDKTTIGCDIEDFGAEIDQFFKDDFLTWKGDFPQIDLVNMNPPYNHSKESAKRWGKTNLLPELFAEKCFKLFGKDTKMILFTPMGLRLNTRCYTKKQGDRYRNMRDNFGKITSIISLPLDLFPNPDFNPAYPEQRRNPTKFKDVYPELKSTDEKVKADPIKYYLKSNIKRKETHQEILLFNMPKLDPHYSLPNSVIEELREMDRTLWGQ